MQYNRQEKYQYMRLQRKIAKNFDHRELWSGKIVYAHAVCGEQFHNCILQYNRR